MSNLLTRSEQSRLLCFLFCLGSLGCSPPAVSHASKAAVGAQAQSSQTDHSPWEFPNRAELIKWCGDNRYTELTYKDYQLIVVFGCPTFGVESSIPYVFIEHSGRWGLHVFLALEYVRGEAAVEGDDLVIWRNKYPSQRSVWFRYNLKEALSHLKAGSN